MRPTVTCFFYISVLQYIHFFLNLLPLFSMQDWSVKIIFFICSYSTVKHLITYKHFVVL